MSLQALVWAIYDIGPTLKDASAYRVLIVLADHADDEGHGAYPSKRTIAEKTGLSKRTVGYKLDDLESSGIIRRGNQKIADCLPGNKRTIVWDLCMQSEHQSGTRNMGAESAPQEQGCNRGAIGVQQGCNLSAPKPIKPVKPLNTLDRQTTYVSNENQVCLSENHIPPVDPLTEESCARSRVDIDHEWELFLEHVKETGEQPRSWVNGFNGWLKQAVKYRDDHPSKDRRDDRTQAKFDHFITEVEKANHYEVSTTQQGILRKAYFDQSLTCHNDGLRALVDTCVSLDLTLPHEQQKI